MKPAGVQWLALETHNWGKAVAFWQAMGYKLSFETGHNSGELVSPNGTRLFVAEVSLDEPVTMEIFVGADEAGDLASDVEVVREWTQTHWGTQTLAVRDPDGRLIRVEAPLPEGASEQVEASGNSQHHA